MKNKQGGNKSDRGVWEWEPGYVGTTAKCSICGLSPMGFYSLPIIQIGRLPEYKYCPNCGAEMELGGVKDGTETTEKTAR
jgi:rubredoxin